MCYIQIVSPGHLKQSLGNAICYKVLVKKKICCQKFKNKKKKEEEIKKLGSGRQFQLLFGPVTI